MRLYLVLPIGAVLLLPLVLSERARRDIPCWALYGRDPGTQQTLIEHELGPTVCNLAQLIIAECERRPHLTIKRAASFLERHTEEGRFLNPRQCGAR
ncbi:MAG TPA: hypothetical protein VHT02_06125 [Methylocella sp.]|jgi:hypothetical protein|nr:hypothetical protein [Methylocella sp.]